MTEEEIYKTFEIESLENKAYYIDVWIFVPLINEGYPVYKVEINGRLSKYAFKKPHTESLHATETLKGLMKMTIDR